MNSSPVTVRILMGFFSPWLLPGHRLVFHLAYVCICAAYFASSKNPHHAELMAVVQALSEDRDRDVQCIISKHFDQLSHWFVFILLSCTLYYTVSQKKVSQNVFIISSTKTHPVLINYDTWYPEYMCNTVVHYMFSTSSECIHTTMWNQNFYFFVKSNGMM